MNPEHTERLIRRALSRRAFVRGAFAATAGGAALYAIGCGGGDDDPSPTATSASERSPSPMTTPGGEGDIRPVLLTSEFVAAQNNRFAVGLLQDARLVKDAAVHARFFKIGADGQTGEFRGEGDLRFVELNVEGAHAHDSTTGEQLSGDEVSFYVANTPFDDAGAWGVELAVAPEGGAPPVTVQVPFEVLAEPKSPAVGSVPPASQNDTGATNPNSESLCSRDPICPLHDKVIADVLGKGRPLVVQFSTPAFCESRFCGPVLEVLLDQMPAHQDRVDFIHIEVWKDFQLKTYREAGVEWNLPTEPYTFLMNGEGAVVGKIEAVFTEEELTNALDQLAAL
ncbi:MAG: hypothetical protein WEB52_10300 [Dehalococcoidia bacterium]